MEFSKPRAYSIPAHENESKIRKQINESGLSGLANNNKWDKLISFFRAKEGWIPSYRFKCINGKPSGWDIEWWYHLPFPFMAVVWFDIGFLQEIHRGQLIKPEIIDHSKWIEDLLKSIRFEYQKGKDFYRIFGYHPRNMELFENSVS